MDHPLIAVAGLRVEATVPGLGLGAHHEAAAEVVHRVQPLAIDTSPIHDVDGAGFRQQRIEDIDVAGPGVGDLDERGDIALQIQQGM